MQRHGCMTKPGRRPAWEIARRLKIQTIASTVSTEGDRKGPILNSLFVSAPLPQRGKTFWCAVVSVLGIESRVGLTRNAWFLGTAFESASLMVATSKVGLDEVTGGVCPSTPGIGRGAIAGAIAIPSPRSFRVRVIQSVHLVCWIRTKQTWNCLPGNNRMVCL